MTVSSPCIKACRLNYEQTYCLSCGRTLQDIRTWICLDDQAKQQAIEAAKQRIKEEMK